MKVLFFSKQGLHPLHLGTELELMKSLLDEGHEVFSLICNSDLQSCYSNPSHNIIACSICSARSLVFFKRIGVNPKNIFHLKNFKEASNITIPNFSSLKDILNFHYKGINIGRGVASSTISIERDYEITAKKQQNELLEFQLKTAINAMLNFEYYLDQLQPDFVYLFNGRFAELHPLKEICKKRGIDFYTFERASSNSKYQTFKNSVTHSISTRKELMEDLWNNSKIDDASKARIAESWFNDKRLGKAKNNKNFLDKQTRDKIPNELIKNNSKSNIAIFNSSEDEMKAIGEWDTHLYDYQNHAIKSIIERFQSNSNYHFYLRIHPNLGKVDNKQTSELKSFSSPNLTIIKPFDDVDTYALIQACDKVISFGSTTGIEATYWGKPSILFGRSFYEQIGAAYEPQSYEELEALIKSNDLKPKPKESTYKYGFFLQSYGIPHQYFFFNDKHNSSFEGKKLKRIYPQTIF
jgi:hypothetical protein